MNENEGQYAFAREDHHEQSNSRYKCIEGPGGVFIDSEGVAGDDEDHDGSNEDGEHGEDPVDFD